MHKVILFRGGMCGDVLLSMLKKKYVENINPLKQNKKHCLMKKFYQYSTVEKNEYFNNFNNGTSIEYTLSHDTDFCYSIKKNVIQVYCSDILLLRRFSERFWLKNDPQSIEHVIKDIKSNEKNKIADYEKNLLDWQNTHMFPTRFDIKTVFHSTFLKYVKQNFYVEDLVHAKTIHEKWLETEHYP